MTKAALTRQHILDHAFNQALTDGLEGTSIGTLAARTGLSKSGLFAHFRSKQALQLAVIEEAVRRFTDLVVRPASTHAPGLPRLRALLQAHLAWTAGALGNGGCPFPGMIGEQDRRPGPVRDALARAQGQLRAVLARMVGQAMRRAEIPADRPPRQVAFELYGTVLAYHVAVTVLQEGDALAHAVTAQARALGIDAALLRGDPPTRHANPHAGG